MTPKDIVETVCTAYQAGDLDEVNRHLADDIKYHNNACPDAGPYVARAGDKPGFDAYIAEIASDWTIEKFKLKQIIVDGNSIATRTDIDYTHKTTGKRVVSENALFWTVKDGKVTEIFEFYDTARMG